MTRLASPLEAVCGLYTTFFEFATIFVQNITKHAAQTYVAFGVATIFGKMCPRLAFLQVRAVNSATAAFLHLDGAGPLLDAARRCVRFSPLTRGVPRGLLPCAKE